MTTPEINLSHSEEPEKLNFKGTFGPLEDEIHIRKFLEKYKNTATFKGAFTHCRVNGIISQKDLQRYNDYWWRCVFTAGLGVFFAAGILGIATSSGVVSYSSLTKKVTLSYFGFIFVSSIGFGLYKFLRLKKEMDAKYTPLYLKSKGKL